MVKAKPKAMTSKAALCLALLEGRVLNVKNCFKEIGYTNIAREIPRLIEKPFCLQVSRTPKEGKNRYGDPVTWTDYRLNKTEQNKEGIEKMKEFVKLHLKNMSKEFVRKYYPESYATGETGPGYEIMGGEDPDISIGEGDSEEMAWADAALIITETPNKNK